MSQDVPPDHVESNLAVTERNAYLGDTHASQDECMGCMVYMSVCTAHPSIFLYSTEEDEVVM